MAYKIAVGSSDGVNVDQTFGQVQEFSIYEVDGEKYTFLEKRKYEPEEETPESPQSQQTEGCAGASGGCGSASGGCGSASVGCGSSSGGGCGSGGGGCGQSQGNSGKVELISDCRCVICKKIGFHIQKQLEKKAIVNFDIECEVEQALKRITLYFAKVDKHQSLRGFSKE